MKYKILALMLALSAMCWAQSTTPQQSTVPAQKAQCACCEKMASADAKDASSCCAHHDMKADDLASCCAKKEVASCCSKDVKSCARTGKDAAGKSCGDQCSKDKSAASCCGDKCMKDAKSCCSSEKKAASECCGHELHS